MNITGSAVSIEKVSFRYDRSSPLVLHDVSATIPAGAVTALLGPNGSGKSTMLHLILGLLSPCIGSVSLLGSAHDRYDRRETSRILGLVPQDEQVIFDLSVLEYVLLGRAPYLGLLERPVPEDRCLARTALEMAGIAELEERLVPSLSGGERQLATVARALTQEPAILLLDEPTSHLDLANARRILAVLASLRKKGRTVILTTHDPNAAAAVADHVVLLRAGEVLAAGSVDETITPAHLSATYGVAIDVALFQGRPWVLTHTRVEK